MSYVTDLIDGQVGEYVRARRSVERHDQPQLTRAEIVILAREALSLVPETPPQASAAVEAAEAYDPESPATYASARAAAKTAWAACWGCGSRDIDDVLTIAAYAAAVYSGRRRPERDGGGVALALHQGELSTHLIRGLRQRRS